MKVSLFVRTALACIFAVVGAAGVASACSSSEPTVMYFDGSSLGYCSGSQADEIRASECVGASCTGSTAYALCNGASYTECACAIPSGYSLGGGVVDSGQGQPAAGVVPFGGGAVLPCCAGNEVFEIPAAECVSANCRGTVGYAVCQDNAYTGCSCDIPAGYGYPDGPGPCNEN